MLEDAERERARISSELAEAPKGDGVPARVQRVLDGLPELVRERLDDLETLLAAQQIDKGKAILKAFDTEIVLHPQDGRLVAEVRGSLGRVLLVKGPREVQTKAGFGGWGTRIRTWTLRSKV